EALRLYEEAGKLLAQVPNGLGSVEKGKGDILYLTQQYEKAKEAYGRARKFYHVAESLHGEGSTYMGEARVEFARHKWQLSAEAARTAGKCFSQRRLISDQIQALIWEARAEKEWGQQPYKALSAAERAISLHGEWRKASTLDVQRIVRDESISRA